MLNLNTIDEIDAFIKDNFMAAVYFGDESCGVCTALFPKLKAMLNKYDNIKLAYVDIKALMEASSKYSIFTMPVFLFYIDSKEILREARFISVDELEEKIIRYYNLVN